MAWADSFLRTLKENDVIAYVLEVSHAQNGGRDDCDIRHIFRSEDESRISRLAVETGVSLGWHKWIGERGDTVALDQFGASAPGPQLMKEFGFTAENVASRALKLLVP